MERQRHYVLLDRDGTVIVDKDYLSKAADVELLPGAAEGMRKLAARDIGLILVTNQSGIGRGMFTLDDLRQVHERLEEVLSAEGVKLAGIYSCPHAPNQRCSCRKPAPEMAENAARDFGFVLQKSWVIGDKAADVELARNIGAKSVLVRTGYGNETERSGTSADFIADDLLQASTYILENLGL